MTAGALADLTGGAIAVSREAATALDLAVGTPVAVRTPRGERVLTVRAVFDSSALDAFARQELPLADYLVTPADHPTVEIASAAELRRRATAAIDPTLRLFYGLLGPAVVVGLGGIVNTLALSILERARELGLLRAIGMDRRQVRSMVAWEGAIVAAIGTVLGAGLGAFLGWAVGRDLDLPPTIPVGQLLLVTAAATAVAVAAASLPARRAARVDVVRAVAVE